MQSVWTNQVEGVELNDGLMGFTVEGRDGKIGKVDHVNYTGTCITVASGLIRKQSNVVPAAALEEIDLDTETVYVRLNADQVHDSPDYDPTEGIDEACEAKVEEYYSRILR
jgi:hypothetical protein